MTPPTLLRWTLRGGTAALAALALAATPAAATSAAQAATSAPATPASRSPAATNPYSPLYGHPYRQGVVPTISALQQMIGWAAQHAASLLPLSLENLSYGGSIHRIGVTTGHEKVYLVVYGSQWGRKGRSSRGNVTLSKDPAGEVPRLQQFFKGLGSDNEKWSGVMTQYCQGVARGAQSCPASNTQHVAYPSGGVLAGVWVDERRASPGQATGHQLGVEAVRAAAHFGNTTHARNRDAQYVILSPTGTHPDGFNTPNGQFCAWHDWNGDTTLTGGAVSSPYGDIAFTNDPYVTNMGSSCGTNFVNSGSRGKDDGITIVEGHEYAETITDQNPSGGWTDWMGQENGDKCAWISPGSSGGAFNLTLSTGTFAMQTTWANDGAAGAGACEGRHAIVHNG